MDRTHVSMRDPSSILRAHIFVLIAHRAKRRLITHHQLKMRAYRTGGMIVVGFLYAIRSAVNK